MPATHTLVMTGASRGIGRFAAGSILEQDPDVHLVIVARDNGGTPVAKELGRNGRSVTLVEADLGSLVSVRVAADRISALLQQGDLPLLRGFVGNAAVMLPNDLTLTADGLESTFAVNVLANHVFLKVLEKQFVAPARITLTVSDAHFGDFKHNLGLMPGPIWLPPETLARPEAFAKPATTAAGLTAYSTSKLAAIYLVHEWSRRLSPGIDVVSYNPGFVPGSGLSRHANAISRFLMKRVIPLLTLTPIASTQKAAGDRLADIVQGRIEAPTGSYVDRAHVERSSEASYDAVREMQLWEAAERLIHMPAR